MKDFANNIHLFISSHYVKCWGFKKKRKMLVQMKANYGEKTTATEARQVLGDLIGQP